MLFLLELFTSLGPPNLINMIFIYRFQELVRSDKLQALDYLHSGFSQLTDSSNLEIEDQVFHFLMLSKDGVKKRNHLGAGVPDLEIQQRIYQLL